MDSISFEMDLEGKLSLRVISINSHEMNARELENFEATTGIKVQEESFDRWLAT